MVHKMFGTNIPAEVVTGWEKNSSTMAGILTAKAYIKVKKNPKNPDVMLLCEEQVKWR